MHLVLIWAFVQIAYLVLAFRLIIKKYKKISIKKYIMMIAILILIPFTDTIVVNCIYYASCAIWADYSIEEIHSVDGFIISQENRFLYGSPCSYYLENGYKYVEVNTKSNQVKQCSVGQSTIVNQNDVKSKFVIEYRIRGSDILIFETKIIKRISDQKVIATQKRVIMQYNSIPFFLLVKPIAESGNMYSSSSDNEIEFEAIPPNIY